MTLQQAALKQIAVFVENRNGAIMEVTEILKDNGINIRALSIADTAEFGVIRLIVDKEELALEKLREHGFIVNLTDVIAIRIDDVPGAFHKVLVALYEAEIMIEYSYAFLSPADRGAYVVLRVQNEDRALASLEKNGITIVNSLELGKN